MRNQGITYDITNDSSRSKLWNYKGYGRAGGSPRLLHKTAFNEDVSHLPRATRELTTFVNPEGEIQSKFAIGYEVEKTRLSRGARVELPLFSHYETDSSCGYEAVTNVLPLVPKGVWRNKVLNMFHQASKILEDSHSPSDTNCGGHITLSCDGMSGADLCDAMRPFSGIIYSIFRKRLNNSYCRANLFMSSSCRSTDWIGLSTGHDSKYQVCRVGSNTIEFRLPNRFQSVKQCIRRYELFYAVMNTAVNGGSKAALMRRLKPIITSMYDGDEQKADRLIKLGAHFDRMLKTNKINKHVQKYVDAPQRLREHWTTDCVREVLTR